MDLRTFADRTIFFGHQSVGANILQGIEELAAQEGVSLRIVEATSATGLQPGTLAHAYVAENTKPELKLQNFERALGATARPDVALLKFCYADIRKDTDVPALFARYQSVLTRLKAQHPGTTFMHVTVPLTAVQSGPKAIIKRLLGRPPGGFSENVRREEFNELLRQVTAGKEPLLDLARIESTTPEGTRQAHEWKSWRTFGLVPAYSDDGAHLNAEGRRRVAVETMSVLAAVLKQR